MERKFEYHIKEGKYKKAQDLAIKCADSGQYDIALKMFNELYDIYIDIYGSDSEQIMYVMQRIAHIYCEQGDYIKILPLNRSLYELYCQRYGEDSLKTLDILLDIVYGYEELERYEEEYDTCKKLLEISLKKYGDDCGVTRNAIKYLLMHA